MYMKKAFFLYILIITVFTWAFLQAQIQEMAQKISEQPELSHASWSFYAVNLSAGTVIADIQARKSVIPASNLKLVTSAVALSVLGPEITLHTFLEYDGRIDKKTKTLNGNLYIRGEGDPTLGSCAFSIETCDDSVFSRWLGAIKKLGINKISGNIIGDDSYLDYMPIPPGWLWLDIGNYYAAGTSGLCFSENLYTLFFKPGPSVNDPAAIIRTEPVIEDMYFFNHVLTGPVGSGDNGYIYSVPWQNLQQTEGTIPAGVPEFSIKGAMPDPALHVARRLKELLGKESVTCDGEATTMRIFSVNNISRVTFDTLTSPPLYKIITRLNKKSVNLYAEQLLKIIGRKETGSGTLEAGLSVVENWLGEHDIDMEGVFIEDGSGLAYTDRVTTKFLVDLLGAMKSDPYFNYFYDSLPIAGDPDDTGTLKNFCTGTEAAGNVHAKTGSHVRVRSHSGYVHNRSGQLIAFSMIANDYSGSPRKIYDNHEKLMIALARLP
jgi:D-alanyl-D-alanine carboxypeptidase/D-alanyl-D-alanine-endopeptidase (penicillin-binding protein 4)